MIVLSKDRCVSEMHVLCSSRFLGEEHNVCKAVINIRQVEDNETQSLEKVFMADSRTYFDSKKSYIILGN